MGTLLRYQIIGLITTINALNTFIGDNETFWQSTSDFIPINSSHDGYYGHIRLWEHMTMSFDLEFHSRVSNVSLKRWEQMFRVGWPAYTLGNVGANSRYPSLWLDNQGNNFHFSLSHSNDGGWNKEFGSLELIPHNTYSVRIEWNDTWVYFSVDGHFTYSDARNYPTKSQYIGQLLNVYIASDSVPLQPPYIIANVTLRNIRIETMAPTPSPTSPTTVPTHTPSMQPTTPPTTNPSNNPTIPPSSHPTVHPTATPSSNPTRTPTSNPSATPTANPTSNPSATPTANPTSNPTSNPSSNPSAYPTTSDPTASPSSNPTATPSSQDATSNSTSNPSLNPTSNPTSNPITANSTIQPSTQRPSFDPIVFPTSAKPSSTPSTNPTSLPSIPSAIGTTRYIVAQQTEPSGEESPAAISNDLIYLTVSACVGCILCSIMVVIIIKSRSSNEPAQDPGVPAQANKKKDGDQSPYVEFPDKSPSQVPEVAPRNEESLTPVIITTRDASTTRTHDTPMALNKAESKPSEGSEDDRDYQQLNADEIAEIRNGMDDELSGEEEVNEEETHNARDHETEYEEATSHHSHREYNVNAQYEEEADEEEQDEDIPPGIDGMDPYDTTTPQPQPQPQPPHIMVKRKYLMSEQLEEEYIKRMMNEVAVVDHGHVRHDSLHNDIRDESGPSLIPMRRGVSGYSSSQKPPPKHDYGLGVIPDHSNHNTEYKAMELVSIVDDNDSDDDTLKNVPIIPVPGPGPAPSTLLDVPSMRSQGMDEESITMLESGYEWITLVLLEIDSDHWREYVDNFKQHGVTEDRLVDLNDADLKALIPHIGPRNEFEKLLENKLGKYHD